MFVCGEATILHADLDAFYASVEQRDDPRLRGRPVIVGGGVVLAASYEAQGVRRPHARWAAPQARRLCPHAIVVQPRMSAYSEASKAVFEVFERHHAAGRGPVDRRGVPRRRRAAADRPGTPTEIAARLRRDVLDAVGLPITVGVARTKFLAKVASGVAKPDGLLVVPPDGELAFLHPLPVERLWGVGPVTAAKLHERGHHDRRRGRPARRGRARLDARAARRAGTCTPWPTTAIPGRCRSAAAGVRSGRSARSAASPTSPDDVDAIARRARRPGHPADAGRRPGRPHRRAPPALRRLHPGDPLAHAAPADRATRRRSSPPRGAAADGACR